MAANQHEKKSYSPLTEEAELRNEALVIATYLLKRPPVKIAIDRYVEGVRVLFTQPVNRIDKKIQAFVRRHPWTLPYLDASSAILGPKQLLRNKILLMVAILETIPDYCGEFFSAPCSKSKFAFEIIGLGFSTAFQVAVGTLLTIFIQVTPE